MQPLHVFSSMLPPHLQRDFYELLPQKQKSQDNCVVRIVDCLIIEVLQ